MFTDNKIMIGDEPIPLYTLGDTGASFLHLEMLNSGQSFPQSQPPLGISADNCKIGSVFIPIHQYVEELSTLFAHCMPLCRSVGLVVEYFVREDIGGLKVHGLRPIPVDRHDEKKISRKRKKQEKIAIDTFDLNLPNDIILELMGIWPSNEDFGDNLLFWKIQWFKHGKGTGLTIIDFFTLVIRLYKKLKLISLLFESGRAMSVMELLSYILVNCGVIPQITLTTRPGGGYWLEELAFFLDTHFRLFNPEFIFSPGLQLRMHDIIYFR